MPIGDKIRELRKAHGLNQTELGERLGVKTNAVSKWECGRVEDVPMSKVRAMAALFDVPVSYLIDEQVQADARNDELVQEVDNLMNEEFNIAIEFEHGNLLRAEDIQMLRDVAKTIIERRKNENPTQD